VVPALIKTLACGQKFPPTAGEQIRDYLHVEDVATALWTLASKKEEALVNIASGVPVTMRQLMETVGRLMGRPELIQYGTVPYRAWEPMFFGGQPSVSGRREMETRLRNAGGGTQGNA